MKHFDIAPHGVCSRMIHLTLTDDNCIESVTFEGGCNGNLQGIGYLVKGMPAREVIARLEGILCGAKTTSCPDQLARVLKQAITE